MVPHSSTSPSIHSLLEPCSLIFPGTESFEKPPGPGKLPQGERCHFKPLSRMERKELTAKQTAQGSPALHKVEAANPTAHAGAAAEQPPPPITVNSLCKGLGLKQSVSADAMCLPLPRSRTCSEEERHAGPGPSPALSPSSRVLRSDPASPRCCAAATGEAVPAPRPPLRPPPSRPGAEQEPGPPPHCQPREGGPLKQAAELQVLKMKPPAVSSRFSACKL